MWGTRWGAVGTAVGRRGESGAAQLAAASRELRSGRSDQADQSDGCMAPPEGRVRGEVAGRAGADTACSPAYDNRATHWCDVLPCCL